MRKILCAVILQVVLGVLVSGRSLDEVLRSMDKQMGYFGKQLSSQIPNLSDPFHNWFAQPEKTQNTQNLAISNQQAPITHNDEPPVSYQGNNVPPSWMTQNQNNIPNWMINPPQNQQNVQRPTTQRPLWNQNVNNQPTQRPNIPQNNQQPQNPAPGPVQQQFTVPPVQITQQPIQNHQTQAPVVLTTIPSWLVPTNQPNWNNQQNINNQGSPNIPNINQPGQNQPNQQFPVNQPNLNNQVNPNPQIPVTQAPVSTNPQLPTINSQTQAPNQMITAPVIQNTQLPLNNQQNNQQTQPVQVTNPSLQPQFTAPVIQATTPLNLVQQNTAPSVINQQTQAPIQHITAPIIQNTQPPIPQQTQAPQIVQPVPIDQWEAQNTAPSWVIPTQQPEIPVLTSHPIFTAPVISRTQQQQVLASTRSPWMPVGPQIIDGQINPQFPTAPSVTNSPRFPTAPAITMIPQFPSLNLIDGQQPWLNQQQNVHNLLENQQNLGIQQVTNSQGVTFPAFTAPVIRKTQPPTNMRQNQLPIQNSQITVPIVTRATTTTFPRVPIITTARPGFPTAGVVTTRPHIPTAGVFTTTTRPQVGTMFPIFPTTTRGPIIMPTFAPITTTRSPLFPIIPQTTTRQPQMTFFPPAVTTRLPNVLQTTARPPIIPIIPQTTTRPGSATARPVAPTIRPPFTTPRSPQAITRPPVVTARSTTTERPQKTTTKEVSRTTKAPAIRQPPRNQQSINDIMRMSDNMLSSLNNQIWQSISRIG